MRAKELILTGRFLRSEEAVACGIALKSLPDGELLDGARELAGRLAKQAPLALAEGKRLINDSADAPLSSGLTFEQRVLGALYATEDAKEGIAAFIEKRNPEFRGK